MTADEQEKLDAVERDRRRREAALLLLLLLLLDQARRFVAQSIRHGTDPIDRINDVIGGQPFLGLNGAAPLFAAAMADAWRAGYRRAHGFAGATVEAMPEYQTLLKQYRGTAAETTTELYEAVTKAVRQSITESRANGLSVQRTAWWASRAFTRFGFTDQSPQTVDPSSTGKPGYSAEGFATDAILTGYNGGYFNGLQAVIGSVTAIRHRSVVDEKTSKICRERDGLTLAPSDPYWLFNWPSLHRHCRSCPLPVFTPNPVLSTVYPTHPPQAGYGVAPTMAFGIRIGFG